MARRSRKRKIPEGIVELNIESLSHDGRGVARIDGKTCFVENALAGETVKAEYLFCSSKFDELKAVEIVEANPDRVEPVCPHFAICGGCSLQHYANEAQLKHKEATLLDQLEHFGGCKSDALLPPMAKETEGYRRKARLGVKFVAKKDKVLVGFRERRSSFLADIDSCAVLHPKIASLIVPLKEFIYGLDARAQIPQLEVAVSGDDHLAIIVRHLQALSNEDEQAWLEFAKKHEFDLYFQSKGPKSVIKAWPEDTPDRLYYEHPGFDVRLAFHPTDFTQVNQGINEAMVPYAIKLLDVQAEDKVLDLFCGLGNFTLALAKRASHVVGVEGSDAMVERGEENARANGIDNVEFHCADLTKEFAHLPWAQHEFDKALIDPPRSGALEVLPHLAKLGIRQLVYVSCNPATLARDAGLLQELGYTLEKVGAMDMFPHTNHVESIALFKR